jgi:hypothetical protein
MFLISPIVWLITGNGIERLVDDVAYWVIDQMPNFKK